MLKIFKQKNMGAGWLYFYVHFVTEVICFYCLTRQTGYSAFNWAFPFLYDCIAFVPQSVIGALSDKYSGLKLGTAGVILMSISALMFRFAGGISPYISLAVLCIGNMFVHVNGAKVTLVCSEGKLSHSAIFVSGGAFGLITGRVLAWNGVPYIFVILLCLSAIPFTLLAELYLNNYDKKDIPCEKFNYANPKLHPALIILIAFFVVIVRGYMGYGIPTSWKKTVLQTVMLYFSMGIGKLLGGISADCFGVRKTAIFSALAAVPFLLAGDKIMVLSLIGIMFFSMTMSITLALLVSVLKKNPGIAFGWTTLGLFIGTVPIFFVKITTFRTSCIVILLLTLVSVAALGAAIRKDGETDERI